MYLGIVFGRQSISLIRNERGGLRFSVFATLLGSIVALSSPAFAEGRAFQLSWQAPSECPSGAEVEAQIERLFNGRATSSASKRLQAVSTIVRSERGVWTVHLETDVDGAHGERVLQGETCKAVSSATALILAMALDPEAVGRALAAPQAPPAPEELTTRIPDSTVAVVAVADVAPAGSPWRPRASALASVLFSILPKPAAAAALSLGVGHRRLGIDLTGMVSEQVRAPAMTRGDAGGSFRLLSAGGRLCDDVWRRSLVIGLCAGARVERISAAGFGVTNPDSRTVTTLAGLSTLAISVPLTRHLSAGIEAELEGRPYRPRFVLGGVGVVYETPLLSASSGVGLRVVF